MEHLKYWKAEDVKEAYKQSLIALAKDRKKQFVSMSRLNLFEDHPRDASFYSEEDDSKVLDYKDAHLGFDPEKYPKLNNRFLHGPLNYGTIKMDGVTRTKPYEELSNKEKLQDDCDIRATNIVLQALPSDVYSLVNHHTVAKELWDRIKLLIQVIKLSLQEHECKLYNKFDQFTSEKGESLHFRVLSANNRPPMLDKFFMEHLTMELLKWIVSLEASRCIVLFELSNIVSSRRSTNESHMILYIKGKEHGRMILDSVLYGPLNYGTIEMDCVTKTRTYEEISKKENLQDDCDIPATNILHQGLPPHVYSLLNHHTVANEI
ncbi:hypothetical protein Tco_1272993 [Tanacetum coccineum]